MRKNALCVVLVLLAAAGTTSAQSVWSKFAGNPVFQAGSPAAWDRNAAGILSVIQDQGLYKAWYAGLDDSAGRIGYATSPNGLSWDRHLTPVLDLGSPGAWDDSQVDHACVLLVGGTYRMWYSGDDGGSSRIGYATSADGIVWEKFAGNPVLDLGALGSWEESEVFHPCVLFDGATYHMWYNGYGLNAQRTGYATSPDGIVWSRHPGNPVLNLGPAGSFDGYMLALMAAVRKDGLFHMWYTAGDGTDGDARYFRIGYAHSPDGITWTKHATNPVLDLGPVGAWDSLGVVTSCVLFDSAAGIFKMWYGGWAGEKISTGYATSDPLTSIEGTTGTVLPDQFVLHQNYPNPCNPRTTIGYELPLRAHITLRVFNLLGEQVAVLLDGERGPGAGTVEFDVSALASGPYIYRLTSGSSVRSKALMVLK